jgi:hypothetical protein
MRKLFNIGIAVIGCFLFTNATGQEAPPPGPNLPCPWGFADIHRTGNENEDLVNRLMCDCSSTGWFNGNDPRNRKCSFYME